MSHEIDPKYGVPILGSAKATEGPNAPGLTTKMEIHDTEIIEIEKVLGVLRNRSMGAVTYEHFDREIRERFQDIGFVVSVAWYTTNVEGTLMPEITISDRTERGHEFDHDRQVHEVTNDVLDLGDKGVIKTDPAQLQAASHQGHKH